MTAAYCSRRRAISAPVGSTLLLVIRLSAVVAVSAGCDQPPRYGSRFLSLTILRGPRDPAGTRARLWSGRVRGFWISPVRTSNLTSRAPRPSGVGSGRTQPDRPHATREKAPGAVPNRPPIRRMRETWVARGEWLRSMKPTRAGPLRASVRPAARGGVLAATLQFCGTPSTLRNRKESFHYA